MDLGLAGKIALVTGGATGIGKAIVCALADAGACIHFTSRNRLAGEQLEQQLNKSGSQHRFWNIDITDKGSPEKLRDSLKKADSLPQILVNNVGDTLGITDPFCGLHLWRKIYRLNLEVHVEMVEFFAPHMIKLKWGRIVNITAGAALENSGPVPYCSLKAAYTAYTRSMARVLAPKGIVMSAVLPGVVLTEEGHWSGVLKDRREHAETYLRERTVLNRFGAPEEISPFVVLLCSQLASFAVGSIVPVEGGQARHYFAGNLQSYL